MYNYGCASLTKKLKEAFLLQEKHDDKLELAVKMLTNKAQYLNRQPKKSDFTPEEVCFIKQKLGPWPRALEKCGLKSERSI